MYRSAARRLLPALCRNRNIPDQFIRSVSLVNGRRRFSTSASSESIPNPSHVDYGSSSSSSSSSSTTAASAAAFNDGEKGSGYGREDQSSRTARRGERTEYRDEQARVLQASLQHVIRLGWTEFAMISGAREIGVSPSIVGCFPRKEAALVEFFMDDCFQRLIDIIDSEAELKNMIPSARVAKLVQTRLEMQAPYISKWPQALSIQAQPHNIPTSFKQRAMLIDEIWHASGDDSTDIDWYLKRSILGGIYSTTELYMLTDSSSDFCDTWTFLDSRIRDAFDLKKTVQEVKNLAHTVSAGMGGSLQALVNQVVKNIGKRL